MSTSQKFDASVREINAGLQTLIDERDAAVAKALALEKELEEKNKLIASMPRIKWSKEEHSEFVSFIADNFKREDPKWDRSHDTSKKIYLQRLDMALKTLFTDAGYDPEIITVYVNIGLQGIDHIEGQYTAFMDLIETMEAKYCK